MIIPGTTVGRVGGHGIALGGVLDEGPTAMVSILTYGGGPQSERQLELKVGDRFDVGERQFSVVRVVIGEGDEAFLEVVAIP